VAAENTSNPGVYLLIAISMLLILGPQAWTLLTGGRLEPVGWFILVSSTLILAMALFLFTRSRSTASH